MKEQKRKDTCRALTMRKYLWEKSSCQLAQIHRHTHLKAGTDIVNEVNNKSVKWIEWKRWNKGSQQQRNIEQWMKQKKTYSGQRAVLVVNFGTKKLLNILFIHYFVLSFCLYPSLCLCLCIFLSIFCSLYSKQLLLNAKFFY